MASTSGTVATPWRFGGADGAHTDATTGLVKSGARYYDPGTGRWTQQDPLNQPFDPVQANRYGYAGCNPVNFVDPSGLRHQCDWVDVVDAAVTLGIGVTALVAGVATAATTPFGVPLAVAGLIGAGWGAVKLAIMINRCREHE